MNTVLIVDDDEDFVWSVSTLLRNKGFSVVEAQAIAPARRLLHRANIVLLDLLLPDGNGMELLDAAEKTQTFILMSGHPRIKSLIRDISGPSIAFLQKPFTTDELTEKLSAHRKPKTLREVERKLIVETLCLYDGNKRDAAKALGISLNTLYNRINAFQIEADATGTFKALK